MANPGFFKKREVWVPTWKGWLAGVLLVLSMFFLFVININSFLSPNSPVLDAEALLVDDWLPDYALDEALKEFNKQNYQKLIITGGQELFGWNATKYESTAELLAAKLMERGIDSTKIRIIKVKPDKKNRTEASSIATNEWLGGHPSGFCSINVISIGVHARRSHYLFSKYLGDQYNVGIISIDNIAYDGDRWWKSSHGFKEVLTEFLAYLYTILLV